MSRRLGLATLGLLGALAIAPQAAGQEVMRHGEAGPRVSIAFAAFNPPEVAALTGEAVTWANDSVRAHDVAAEDERFDSGRMALGGTFSQRFEEPGVVAYFCRLHPSMRGRIVVATLLLDAPAAAASPGRPFPLHGHTRLPVGTRVTLTAQPGPEAPPAPVATATVGEDGKFSAEVRPSTTVIYRAVVGEATSPPVTLLVLDRRVAGTVRRTARLARVTAAVTPAAPGATVVLQARSREHFGWYPLRRGRLDGASRVRFAIPLRRRLPLRVVLTLADGATILASSGPLPRGR